MGIKIVATSPNVLTIATMVAILPVAVIPWLTTVIAPVPVTTLIAAIAMMFPVMRSVFAVVPAVLHKENSLSAGVVVAAMPAPMSGVARRHVQVDRRAVRGYLLDYDRPAVDDLRLRIFADVEPTIEAGLPDAERHANVGGECRRGGGGSRDGGRRGCDQKSFHVEAPAVART